MLTYGFALRETDNSEDFSRAFFETVGDGVCEYGGKFTISLKGGFNFALAPGFALCNGRYLKNTEPYNMTLTPSGNYADRYDAVAVRANYADRKVYLEVLTDINPDSPKRDADDYVVYLYTIFVKRGTTVLTMDNITDRRQFIGYLSDLSYNALRVYNFLNSGIDAEVARVIGLSQALISHSQREIAIIDEKIAKKGKTEIGEVITSLEHPEPILSWLICNGEAVPDEYHELSEILSGTLPDISPDDARYQAYIYGGTPAGME